MSALRICIDSLDSMDMLSQMTRRLEEDTKVTIGLCVKNSEKTIEKTIYSIISQRYPKDLIQMIVVDGCSKDETIPILSRLISKGGLKAEIYTDDGRGLGVARQIAVNNAKGEYIVFVGADVELMDDFIQKQVDFLEKNPKIGISAGRHMYKDGPLISAVWSLHHYASKFGYDALFCRFEAIKQVGGFDENIKGASEDKDLILRIKMKGWDVSVNYEARFYHLCRENLRDFLNEQAWFGYGNHYLNHKYNHTMPLWRNIPAGSFLFGLTLSLQAYESTRKKISFLIPLLMLCGNIAWWFGFGKGHIDGYGHNKNDST